jgi:hypothetical protein
MDAAASVLPLTPPVPARVRRAGTILIVLGCAWGLPILFTIAVGFLGLVPSSTREGASWLQLMAVLATFWLLIMPVPRVLAGIAIRRGSRTARKVALVMTALWIGMVAMQGATALVIGLGPISSVGLMVVITTAIAAADIAASAWVVWALATG